MVSRLAHDIDIVINLSQNEADKFANAFSLELFYCPPIEVIKTELKRTIRGHFNLIHHETGFKADIYFTGKDEFQQWALKNRKSIEYSELEIYIAPPEYVIIKKLEFYKEGKSHKHISDIQGILANSNELIDHKFLQKKITEFALGQEWKLVLNVD